MFKKYSSIENHYQNKYIAMFLEWHPELKDVQYVVEHKIDGANISILINENNEVFWAKRSGKIGNDNFMGLNEIKHEYDEIINNLIEWKTREDVKELQIYGEIYGPGIQNRVNYGDKKRIDFFDCRLDGVYMSSVWFYEMMNDIGWIRRVRTLELVQGLENALKAKTSYYTEQGSLIEGVVIKPYINNYYSPVGERFVLKIKNKEFAEKMEPKKRKEKSSFRDEVENLRSEFESYINESRLLSAFSKEGEIEDTKDIGKYIKFVLEDAKDDFYKENTLPDDLTKTEEKYIFNVSKGIVEMLKRYL